MSVFKQLLQNENSEVREQKKAVQEERNFVRDSSLFDAGLNDPTNYYQQSKENGDLIRWQQDPDEIIKDLKLNLLNIAETDNGYVQLGAPMINEQGVYRIISIVKQHLNRNFMMSNFDNQIINRLLLRLRTDLVINIGDNFEEYEITNLEDLSLIIKMTMNPMEAVLYSALNDGWRKHLNTTNKRVEAYNATTKTEDNKKGWGLFA